MRSGERIPKVASGATLREAVAEMSRGGIGMTAVVDANGKVIGVFTDGDLRRTVEKGRMEASAVDDVMTARPKHVRPDMLAAEAVHVMEAHKITQLPVVDAAGALVGALNLHDLFRAKVL